MDNKLLAGLESMGLGKMADLDLYGNTKEEKKPEAQKNEPVQINEADFLLAKTMKCPVCDTEFKCKTIKTAKMPKLIARDPDLRCIYADVDVYKYGVVSCPICGYASMMKTFGPMPSGQVKLIKEQISANFTGLPNGKYVDLVSGASVNVSNGSLSASVRESNVGIYVLDNGASEGTLGKIR